MARKSHVTLLPFVLSALALLLGWNGISFTSPSQTSTGRNSQLVQKLRRGAVSRRALSTEVAPIDLKSVTPSDSAVDNSWSFRQNYAEETEIAMNRQVKMELDASHAYFAMAAFFDRADVALPGFKNWASKQAEEEREHAEKLIEYINLRGGTYVALPVQEPEKKSWTGALDAMKTALAMEMHVNDALLKLHGVADKNVDPALCDFLEGNYLAEQVESINDISHTIRKLIRAGPGLGEYEVDKDFGA